MRYRRCWQPTSSGGGRRGGSRLDRPAALRHLARRTAPSAKYAYTGNIVTVTCDSNGGDLEHSTRRWHWRFCRTRPRCSWRTSSDCARRCWSPFATSRMRRRCSRRRRRALPSGCGRVVRVVELNNSFDAPFAKLDRLNATLRSRDAPRFQSRRRLGRGGDARLSLQFMLATLLLALSALHANQRQICHIHHPCTA